MDSKETFRYDIHTEIPGYDVVEMDFPEYAEEFPPIGVMTSEKPFSLNKTEIYRRNTQIALWEQRKAFAETAPKSAGQEEYEQLCREADEILSQTDDVRKLAENMPPDALMNLMFNYNRQAEPKPSLDKKVLDIVAKIAVFLLFVLIAYIARH